jgi:SAM-dependent methyltransferase
MTQLENWNFKYLENKTGWNIGYASTPLKEYFDQLQNKKLKILVPGAGHGWEAGYLFSKGFDNVFYMDIAPKAIEIFCKNHPDFPQQNIIIDDFFTHRNEYDLIIEQTFFCSFNRNLRPEYAKKCFDLLQPGGKLVGLLFNHEFGFDYQPFGGTPEEYESLFKPYFNFKVFETANNSIKPRKDREVFMILEKK